MGREPNPNYSSYDTEYQGSEIPKSSSETNQNQTIFPKSLQIPKLFEQICPRCRRWKAAEALALESVQEDGGGGVGVSGGGGWFAVKALESVQEDGGGGARWWKVLEAVEGGGIGGGERRRGEGRVRTIHFREKSGEREWQIGWGG